MLRLTFEDMFHIESVLGIFLKQVDTGQKSHALATIRQAHKKIEDTLDQANRDGVIDFTLLEKSRIKLREE